MEFQVVEKVYVKAQELRSIIEEKQFVLKSSTSDILICMRLPVDRSDIIYFANLSFIFSLVYKLFLK